MNSNGALSDGQVFRAHFGESAGDIFRSHDLGKTARIVRAFLGRGDSKGALPPLTQSRLPFADYFFAASNFRASSTLIFAFGSG